MMDSGERPGGSALSNRQRRILVKKIRKAQAAAPKPEPVRPEPAEYVAPEIRHEDDRIIPGLSGLGAVQRLDTLGKLYEAGKISTAQYCAGRDYLGKVEDYFASASGLAKLSEEAGAVGGTADPIRLYIKARPWSNGKGYVPTQRPRNRSAARARSDGWSNDKLKAMTQFTRMTRVVGGLSRDARMALCLLVIDPNRPEAPAMDLANASRRLFGYKHPRTYDRLTKWLREALDELDDELTGHKQAA